MEAVHVVSGRTMVQEEANQAVKGGRKGYILLMEKNL